MLLITSIINLEQLQDVNLRLKGCFFISPWGIRGQLVRAIDLESLAPHCCGFESRQGLSDSFR